MANEEIPIVLVKVLEYNIEKLVSNTDNLIASSAVPQCIRLVIAWGNDENAKETIGKFKKAGFKISKSQKRTKELTSSIDGEYAVQILTKSGATVELVSGEFDETNTAEYVVSKMYRDEKFQINIKFNLELVRNIDFIDNIFNLSSIIENDK